MAKYNRDFLVSYLHSACALELAKNDLVGRKSSINDQIGQLQDECTHEYAIPTAPIKPEEVKGTTKKVLLTVIGIIIANILVYNWLSEALLGLGIIACWLFTAITGIGGIIAIIFIGAEDSVNKEQIKKYEKEKANWEMVVVDHRRHRSCNQVEISKLSLRVNELEKEINKLNDVRDSFYSINVIPGTYRNVYAAMYLYDYFAKSRADDLDMVLNTFVLEQIKDKMNVLISQQREMMLQEMLTNTQQSHILMKMQDKQNEMLEALSQTNASIENISIYHGMVQSNLEAIRYFSAATYYNSL